ncbi:MAG: translation initiation factor [Pirellula sp.]|nr:translation initiation factor [Pirellula sp.]
MRLFEGTQWDRPPRCERCGLLEAECHCPPPPVPPPVWLAPEKQSARVTEEKRPGGRRVTVVRGLVPAESDFAALLAQLKNACGAGGTVRDDLIEIQGSHAERVATHLRNLGYRVKN